MNYIIFDLEATCEKNNREYQNETIEIGSVKLNSKLDIVDTFVSFVKPVVNPILTDFCKELTTIKQSDVDNAPKFPNAIQSFQDWIGLKDEYLLVSWGKYDKNQLRSDSTLHHLDSKWVTERHVSFKHLHGEHILSKLPKDNPLRNRTNGIGMEKALKLAKLPLLGTHHRGIDDAHNIAQLFQCHYEDIKDHLK